MDSRIIAIDGPVIKADNMFDGKMNEMVEVGHRHLIGEIIKLKQGIASIQVYENTSGLKLEEPVYKTGMLLSVELGPGLISSIFDGIQRPLHEIMETTKSDFIERGIKIPALNRDKKWEFVPQVKKDTKVGPGDVIGVVEETKLVSHKIMVPIGVSGIIKEIAEKGFYKIEDEIAKIGEKSISMIQNWSIRSPRPYEVRLLPEEPLITGQRVIDTFFPIVKGGAGAIPGGFGSGKTITLQQIAKWASADIIIIIGCGERGNEMAEVLDTFPKLIDPASGRPLMERTVVIANTSNMPVSAREASIYTGVAIGEYFRDMGYDVAVIADSTSRWAEALREISARLEEIPAEESYPSYLPSRIAEFYERAGNMTVQGSPVRNGSLSIMGAVSPPAGDFSEPVTRYSTQNIRVLWALDKKLADLRHYPAINWVLSFSQYVDYVRDWWHHKIDIKWARIRDTALKLLTKDEELMQIVKLIGSESLPDNERLVLFTSKLIKEGFLRQNAMDAVDTYTPPQKQYKMLEVIINFYNKALEVIEKRIPIYKVSELSVIPSIMKMKSAIKNDELMSFTKIEERAVKELNQLLE